MSAKFKNPTMSVQARDVKSRLALPPSLQERRKAAHAADQRRIEHQKMPQSQQHDLTRGSGMHQSEKESPDKEVRLHKATHPQDCDTSASNQCIFSSLMTSDAKLGRLATQLANMALGASKGAPVPASIDVSCTWLGRGKGSLAARLEFAVEERKGHCPLTCRSIFEFTLPQTVCQSEAEASMEAAAHDPMLYQ